MYKGGKKPIKGEILRCLQQAETTDLNEPNKRMFREDIGKKEKQSMIRKSEILAKAFIWDLGELGPFQDSVIYFLWDQK